MKAYHIVCYNTERTYVAVAEDGQEALQAVAELIWARLSTRPDLEMAIQTTVEPGEAREV